jgi:tripeptide aminopeptidase
MYRLACGLCIWLSFTLCFAVTAQESLLSRDDIQGGLQYIVANYERFIEKQIQISEIPAPPFKEQTRAEFMAGEFKRVGLDEVETDAAGNVLGWRRGRSDGVLAITAHLDTVFPEGTDVRVTRNGDRLHGPGLMDDALGLMDLLALVETMDHAQLTTAEDLLFVATVGEEGLGDLRGVKQLFLNEPMKGRIDAFISIDGASPRGITHRALGSKRYRITVNGTGGHSWADFGRVNPAHALGRIIASFTAMPVPTKPRSSYNIGRIGGGTSVNSIPFEAWMEVDMRSESNEALQELEKVFLSTVNQGIDAENLFRSTEGSKLTVDVDMIGDRPSGTIPRNDPLVVAAKWAAEVLDLEPHYGIGSTDANIAISMGIPAISIGGGGIGGEAHSPSEWYDPREAHVGLQRILLLVMAYDQAAARVR